MLTLPIKTIWLDVSLLPLEWIYDFIDFCWTCDGFVFARMRGCLDGYPIKRFVLCRNKYSQWFARFDEFCKANSMKKKAPIFLKNAHAGNRTRNNGGLSQWELKNLTTRLHEIRTFACMVPCRICYSLSRLPFITFQLSIPDSTVPQKIQKSLKSKKNICFLNDKMILNLINQVSKFPKMCIKIRLF